MAQDYAVVFGLVVGIFPLLIFSFVIGPSIKTEDSFYLASEELSKRGLFTTLGSSWIFLGNVIIGKRQARHSPV